MMTQSAAFDFTDEKENQYRVIVAALEKEHAGLILPDSNTNGPEADAWLRRVLVCMYALDGVSTEALETDPAMNNLGQCFNDLGVTLVQLYTVVKANFGEARARSLVHGVANHVLDNVSLWAKAKDGSTVVVHQGDLTVHPDGEGEC